MAGKNYINIVREQSYGVAPTTGWVGLPVEDLGGHTPVVPIIQPNVMRYGQQGPRARDRRAIERHATGMIKTPLVSAGLLLLLEATFGIPEVTELAAGEAYEYVFETDDMMSTSSFATQVGREFKGGGLDRDTFVGGQVDVMRLNQGLPANTSGVTDEGLAKLEFDVQYQRRNPSVPEYLPTYGDPEVHFTGGDLVLEVGPDLDNLAAECLNEFALVVPTGGDWEERCISTEIRDQVARGTLPAPTIQAAWSYKARKYYDAWLSGELFALRSKWQPTGAVFLDAAESIKPSFQIEIPTFGLTGETPVESATETTKQNLPSQVLYNDEDPMMRITVVTSELPPVDEES